MERYVTVATAPPSSHWPEVRRLRRDQVVAREVHGVRGGLSVAQHERPRASLTRSSMVWSCKHRRSRFQRLSYGKSQLKVGLAHLGLDYVSVLDSQVRKRRSAMIGAAATVPGRRTACGFMSDST